MHAPDPVVTASIYADARLDAVLREGLAPFLRAMVERGSSVWSAWFVRYARGGEHLKVRLHGPSAESEAVRELLSVNMRRCFESLPVDDAGAARASRPDAPAIDTEDAFAGEHPDRTVRWTEYRRSHVSLGPPPLLDDDGYVARITACLASGSALAITALDAPGTPTAGMRQRPLLAAIAGGLAALPLDAETRAGYLAYHRDWLLRFLAGAPGREEAGRASLDGQVDRMAATVGQLRGALTAAWDGGGGTAEPSGLAGALAELHRYLARFRGNPAFDVDPFAADLSFPVLFKVFHGLANQLGLPAREEALLHHLCLRAAGAGSTAAVPAEV